MSYEQLIMHSVTASVRVTAPSADRIGEFLPHLAAPRDHFRFKIGKRAFKIAASPERRVEPDELGSWTGTLLIENDRDPSDVIAMRSALMRSDPRGDARLTLTFNPSQLLAGAGIVPTMPDTKDPMRQSPASSKLVNTLLLGIGFGVLNDVYVGARNEANLIESRADGAYYYEDIQLHRVEWDLLLRSSDPREFLSYLVLIFEPTFRSDGRFFRLSSLLKTETSWQVNDESGAIETVTFTRLQGPRRKLFSIAFSVFKSEAPDGGDVTDFADAASKGEEHVRMRVTAFPDGIDQLIREGLGVTTSDEEDDVYADFKPVAVMRNAADFREAIAHLAENEIGSGDNQGSFPRSLARKILRDILHLDVIGCFAQKDVEAVCADTSAVAQAWARGGVEPMDTGALAFEAKVSDEMARKFRSKISRRTQDRTRHPAGVLRPGVACRDSRVGQGHP